MDKISDNCAFDAEDQKVYGAWLQVVLAGYGGVILCGVAAVALAAAANLPNVAEFLTGAVALASP